MAQIKAILKSLIFVFNLVVNKISVKTVVKNKSEEMKKFCAILLVAFVACAAAQNADEKRRSADIHDRKFDASMPDISADEKEAIHEAVRLLSMQHHIDPKERTQILKDLMSGEIDFKEALEKARAGGSPDLGLDPKYATKIEEVSERLKHRRSRHIDDLEKSREEMRARRKARVDAKSDL